MLLATWMADCPVSVAHFLFNTANVPYVSFLVQTNHYLEDLQRAIFQKCKIWPCENCSMFILENQ